jgi:putative membrane protein
MRSGAPIRHRRATEWAGTPRATRRVSPNLRLLVIPPMSCPHLLPAARRRAILAAGLAVLCSACAADDSAARRDSIVAAAEEAYDASHRASAPPDTAGGTASAPAALTDNNILARVAQDDRLEVQVAGIAIGKITSGALKDFARQIKDNHSAGESDARRLSQRLKIPETPAANDTTKQHQQTLVARFGALPKGKPFDAAYARHLVDGHTAMLAELKVMAEKATNAEVKQLLAAATPEVQRHLNRARELEKALAATK